MLISCCVDYHKLRSNLKSGSMSPPTLFFCFIVFLAKFVLFHTTAGKATIISKLKVNNKEEITQQTKRMGRIKGTSRLI